MNDRESIVTLVASDLLVTEPENCVERVKQLAVTIVRAYGAWPRRTTASDEQLPDWVGEIMADAWRRLDTIKALKSGNA